MDLDVDSPAAIPIGLRTFSEDMSAVEVSTWLKTQGIPEQFCKAFEGTNSVY